MFQGGSQDQVEPLERHCGAVAHRAGCTKSVFVTSNCRKSRGVTHNLRDTPSKLVSVLEPFSTARLRSTWLRTFIGLIDVVAVPSMTYRQGWMTRSCVSVAGCCGWQYHSRGYDMGESPLCAYLVELLAAGRWKLAIVNRGYGQFPPR